MCICKVNERVITPPISTTPSLSCTARVDSIIRGHDNMLKNLEIKGVQTTELGSHRACMPSLRYDYWPLQAKRNARVFEQNCWTSIIWTPLWPHQTILIAGVFLAQWLINNIILYSLVHRLLGEKRKEPGTHCLRMRLITLTFQGSGYFPCMSVCCDVTDERVTDRSLRTCPGQMVSK